MPAVRARSSTESDSAYSSSIRSTTPFRDQRDKLVDMVIEQFPWTLADVLGDGPEA